MNKNTRHVMIDSSIQRTSRRGFLRGGVVALIGATTLAGCGQKGPLFLPDEDGKKKKKQS